MARTKLYIDEHMKKAGISDNAMARVLGCSRHTVLRARQNPHKVTQARAQQFAEALGYDDWKALTYPPMPEDRLAAILNEAEAAVADFKRGDK
jgi:transcriptional regulator with XRE-family HTH domain